MTFTMTPAVPRKKYGETSFGQRLIAMRKARGLTQIQLAKAAATTQRAISYYENEAGFACPRCRCPGPCPPGEHG